MLHFETLLIRMYLCTTLFTPTTIGPQEYGTSKHHQNRILQPKKLQIGLIIKNPMDPQSNARVIMNTEKHDKKLREVVRIEKYKEMNRDPTTLMEAKIYRTLYKYLIAFLNQHERYRLIPRHSKPPHLYGLPKIHKLNILLRPIVSYRNSPCCPVVKFFLQIITAISKNTYLATKGINHFINENLIVKKEDIFGSYYKLIHKRTCRAQNQLCRQRTIVKTDSPQILHSNKELIEMQKSSQHC